MSVTTAPVSLVKHYFTAGWNLPGCLPDSDQSAPLFTTLDDARAYLADELDRAANELADSDTDENASSWDDVASMEASAELIRSDRDGDIAATGSWFTIEPDGYAYWIQTAEL